MSNIERLDFSKPPPGYTLYETTNEDGPEEWGWWAENDFDIHDSRSSVMRSAWAHYKSRHDPPGMWSGYCAILPLCDQYRPRMGVSIPGVAHLELYASAERLGTCEQAKAMGRAAAWAHYVDAVEVAVLLDGENGPAETWPERCAWPRPLTWTTEQRDEVRCWLVDSNVKLPEALRVR